MALKIRSIRTPKVRPPVPTKTRSQLLQEHIAVTQRQLASARKVGNSQLQANRAASLKILQAAQQRAQLASKPPAAPKK